MLKNNKPYSFISISKGTLFLIITIFLIPTLLSAELIIIDHTSTDITEIPQSAIEQAKTNLHIAYGHTSHGSQLTTGMTGLVAFANGGGLGLSLPDNTFTWNNGGTGGALDLHDYFQSGDLGNPDRETWAQRTRDYLDDPSHSDVNVIIWSWCGQVNASEEQIDLYLALMNQLEIDYPDVTFVYMTGHANGTGDTGNVHLRNQQIRNYCIANDKVLYDFYDIECYDPDGNYYGDKYVTDTCAYDSNGDGNPNNDGANWAIEWQNSHVEGVDWYSCGSAHSEPLNANRKAYAVWWLWARIAGWSPNEEEETQLLSLHNGWNLISICQYPVNTSIESVLDTIQGQGISVWAYTNQMWQVYDPDAPGLSDLNEWVPGKGYWINMNDDAELSVGGVPHVAPITLLEGWNLVGYNSSDSQTTSDAISSISSHILSVWAYQDGQWKVYDPENPGFSDLILMEPGHGYWINANQACTWSLP